ncbi:MAG: hypothetical protein ACFE91_01240 [Promethearchaeota archaeon]
MTKKSEFKKEILKINQINDKEDSKSIDSYIRLYTQVVREVSESLKQKGNLLNIYISEVMGDYKISSNAKIHYYFKKLQNSSKT